MKFDILDILDGDAMESGAYLHFISPIDGEPLYRDPETKTLPCRALVRSAQSQFVKSATFKNQLENRAKIQRARKADKDTLAEQLVGENEVAILAMDLIGLENCTSEKTGFVKTTLEDVVALAADPKMRWMVEQIIGFANEPANYPRPTSAGAKAAGERKAQKAA